MTAHDNPVPARLWHAVSADLRPVRALPSTAARALMVAPLGLALLVAAPMVFSWREDLARVGWAWSWGASLAQVAAGLALVALALREAVPGRAVSRTATGAAVAAASLLVVVVTLLTAAVTHIGPLQARRVGAICFLGSLGSAVPAVLVAGMLARRAFPLRPRIVGALYGLGAGLMADAGWRLFCEFSVPSHVFPFHLGAIAGSTVLGIAWAVCIGPSLNRSSR